MKTQTVKLKILAVGPEQKHLTTTKTTRKVVMTVGEISMDNPFGNSKEPGPSFEVEVYNHNIEEFNISNSLIGEIADCQLDIRHYKGNSNVPAGPKFIVNDLSFRL